MLRRGILLTALFVAVGFAALVGSGPQRASAAPLPGLDITVDRGLYYVGDDVRACFTVPWAGTVEIYNVLNNGDYRSIYYRSFIGSRCVTFPVNAADGYECLEVVYDYKWSDDVCYLTFEKPTVTRTNATFTFPSLTSTTTQPLVVNTFPSTPAISLLDTWRNAPPPKDFQGGLLSLSFMPSRVMCAHGLVELVLERKPNFGAIGTAMDCYQALPPSWAEGAKDILERLIR